MTWSVPDRIIMSILHGRCGTVNIHSVLNLINSRAFPGWKLTRIMLTKRILEEKGFAVGRLKKHNFCPASALRNRCCIDTKRCSSAYTQQQVLR